MRKSEIHKFVDPEALEHLLGDFKLMTAASVVQSNLVNGEHYKAAQELCPSVLKGLGDFEAMLEALMGKAAAYLLELEHAKIKPEAPLPLPLSQPPLQTMMETLCIEKLNVPGPDSQEAPLSAPDQAPVGSGG